MLHIVYIKYDRSASKKVNKKSISFCATCTIILYHKLLILLYHIITILNSLPYDIFLSLFYQFNKSCCKIEHLFAGTPSLFYQKKGTPRDPRKRPKKQKGLFRKNSQTAFIIATQF